MRNLTNQSFYYLQANDVCAEAFSIQLGWFEVATYTRYDVKKITAKIDTTVAESEQQRTDRNRARSLISCSTMSTACVYIQFKSIKIIY